MSKPLSEYSKDEMVELLKSNVRKWDGLREEEPGFKPDLSGADLVRAKLRNVNLRFANLEGANLRFANLEGTNLEDAKLEGAKLARANLGRANLVRANLQGANLVGADLASAKLARVKLVGAKLFRADLRDANFKDADLGGADLRDAKNLAFNRTKSKGAYFGLKTSEPWTNLWRNYTGTKMFFSLIFLSLFALPYIGKTLMWKGVNRAQVGLIEVTEELRHTAEELESKGSPQAVLVRNAMNRISGIEPCLSDDCKEYPVWKVLIGADKGWLYWALALTLLFYNLCRGLLTWKIGPMKDVSDHDGLSPPRYGRRGYNWLILPHRIVKTLFWIAVVAFLVNAWEWLFNTTVWLPS